MEFDHFYRDPLIRNHPRQSGAGIHHQVVSYWWLLVSSRGNNNFLLCSSIFINQPGLFIFSKHTASNYGLYLNLKSPPCIWAIWIFRISVSVPQLHYAAPNFKHCRIKCSGLFEWQLGSSGRVSCTARKNRVDKTWAAQNLVLWSLALSVICEVTIMFDGHGALWKCFFSILDFPLHCKNSFGIDSNYISL